MVFEIGADHGSAVRNLLEQAGFENITLVLGAENALDEDAPFAIGDGDTDLYGYVSGMHDPRGRFVYGRMTYSF